MGEAKHYCALCRIEERKKTVICPAVHQAGNSVSVSGLVVARCSAVRITPTHSGSHSQIWSMLNKTANRGASTVSGMQTVCSTECQSSGSECSYRLQWLLLAYGH